VHIATHTGWKDRLTLLPIFEEWMSQKPADRLWFLEEWIGYLYLDFVEYCDGARPPSVSRSRFSVQLPGWFTARRLRFRFVPAAPPPSPPRARQSHDCRLQPLGGAHGGFGVEREAWPRGLGRGC